MSNYSISNIYQSAGKVFLALLVFFISNTLAFSQEEVFEFEVTVENANSPALNDGAINIKCISFSSSYTYFLYDTEPIGNAQVLKQSDKISDNEYSFSDLKPGVYFVCVYDHDNNSSCNKVEISPK